MEVFLFLNGFEIQSSVEEQERIVLQVASGEMDRGAFYRLAHRSCRDKVVKVGG